MFPGLVMQEIDILALLRSACFISLFFFFCTDLSEYDRTQIQEALNDSLLTSTHSVGVRTEFLEDGYLKIVMKAEEAANYTEYGLNETRLKGSVSIVVYDSTGNVTTTALAQRAKYIPEASIFELFDDVVVYTIGDRKLSTEYLKWDRNTDKISTPEFVIIVTPRDSLSGKGFEGITDLSEFTITDNGSNAGGKVIIDD